MESMGCPFGQESTFMVNFPLIYLNLLQWFISCFSHFLARNSCHSYHHFHCKNTAILWVYPYMAVSENGVYRQPSPWEGKTHENPWELGRVQVFPTFSDKTHMVSRCFTMFQWVAGSSFQAWMTPLDLSGPSGFGVRSPGWPEPDGLSRTDPWTGPGLLFLGTLGLMGEKSVWDIGTLCGLIYFCWTDLLFLYFIFGGWALRVTFGHKTKLSGYCVQLVFWFSLSFRIALFCTQGCISKNGIRHLTVHPEFLTGLLKCFDLQCNLQSGD